MGSEYYEYYFDEQLGAVIGYHLEKLGDRLVAVLKPGPCIVCVASGNSTKTLPEILTAEERVLLARALCEGTSSQVTNR